MLNNYTKNILLLLTLFILVFSFFLFASPQTMFAQQAKIPDGILDNISNFDQISQQKIIQQLSNVPESTLEALDGLSEEKQMDILRKLLEIPTNINILNKATVKDVKIKTLPLYPEANQKVTATIVSNLLDISRTNIFWYIDNKLVSSGFGVNKIEFSTKDAGKSTVIDVVLKTRDGSRIDKRLIITPAELDIIWEAESYTPPFYKGKALLSPKTTQKIIAIPNFVTNSGRKIPANELIYTWREDGRIIKDKSGYGKNVIYLEAPEMFWEKKISVEVSSFGKSINAYKSITPKVTPPTVILYEDNPIQGIWYSRAIKKTLDLTGKELVLKAEPYFFSNNDIAVNNLRYDWSLNKNPVIGEKNKLILRQEGPEGSALIGINVKNTNKLSQSAKESFLLNFRNLGAFNF